MTWRTVVIHNKARLSYKNGYLIVRNDDINMLHLSEISTLIIDSTAVSITSYLISELIKRKIKIVFCDEKRNPQCELIPYYGSHDTSQCINKQINWNNFTQQIWTEIVKEKINNQMLTLKNLGIQNYKKLNEYLNSVELMDTTNREGHAAKVYFNSLFGNGFSRDENSNINAALNYGYSIILSQFNKSIVSLGYLTQLGINHHNMFNHFNLSSDLMEPFRPLIDCVVYQNKELPFDNSFKRKLIDILNRKVVINGKEQYINNAINIYVKSVITSIEEEINAISFIKYEL